MQIQPGALGRIGNQLLYVGVPYSAAVSAINCSIEYYFSRKTNLLIQEAIMTSVYVMSTRFSRATVKEIWFNQDYDESWDQISIRLKPLKLSLKPLTLREIKYHVLWLGMSGILSLMINKVFLSTEQFRKFTWVVKILYPTTFGLGVAQLIIQIIHHRRAAN